jgi:hypothetical protein
MKHIISWNQKDRVEITCYFVMLKGRPARSCNIVVLSRMEMLFCQNPLGHLCNIWVHRRMGRSFCQKQASQYYVKMDAYLNVCWICCGLCLPTVCHVLHLIIQSPCQCCSMIIEYLNVCGGSCAYYLTSQGLFPNVCGARNVTSESQFSDGSDNSALISFRDNSAQIIFPLRRNSCFCGCSLRLQHSCSPGHWLSWQITTTIAGQF